MAKLTGPIPPQNFELIRDRIGAILCEELEAQYRLSRDSAMNPTVYCERMTAFQHPEMPAINVMLDKLDYDNKDARGVDGSYIYVLDCYASAPYSSAGVGDTVATLRLQRIMGMCRAILENPAYRTLDFAPGAIGGVRVTSMAFTAATENDSTSTMIGRISLEVRAVETTALQPSRAASLGTTVVKLEQTDKGYIWIYDGNADAGFASQAHEPFAAQDGESFKPISVQ